jgi:hypothetical protein
MKIGNLLIGIVVVVLSALLFANGILSYLEPTSQYLSLEAVEIITGFSLLALAASVFLGGKR